MTTEHPVPLHGVAKAVGCSHAAVSRFGKLFTENELPGVSLSQEEAAILGGPGGIMHDFDGTSRDSGIPAGYTFFAQFIDHDVTLDGTTGLRDTPRERKEIEALPNVRSVSLDLDCVYGFGPEGSPHIYDTARPGRLAIGPDGHDLARSPGGVALIGDPRNDENIFVSQLQLLFHRFHNKLHNERVHQEEGKGRFNRFEKAQQETRYHYQWLVLFDFLKRLCDRSVYKFAAAKIFDGSDDFPYYYKSDERGELIMPVEFSVAAYRVGHTMVRSQYAVNGDNLDVELFDERFGTQGFGAVPQHLVVDWRYLLPVDKHLRPRMSKAIDPLLADEIQDMPRPVVPSNNPNDRALGFRNLMRGNAMSLPSGQAAATELARKGYPVDTSFDLRLDDVAGWSRLDAIDRAGKPTLREQTPLFYYILRESELANDSTRLGPLGSSILMEVFGGMLACKTSFTSKPGWHPDPCVSKERYAWWSDTYQAGFDRDTLINDEDYYPFELADVVRFVEDSPQG